MPGNLSLLTISSRQTRSQRIILGSCHAPTFIVNTIVNMLDRSNVSESDSVSSLNQSRSTFYVPLTSPPCRSPPPPPAYRSSPRSPPPRPPVLIRPSPRSALDARACFHIRREEDEDFNSGRRHVHWITLYR